MKVTKLLKKEHPQTGTVITGYGTKHFVKKWNLHVINNKLDFFIEKDIVGLSDVDAIIKGKDSEEKNIETKTDFKSLSADEQKEFLESKGIEPGANQKIRAEQFSNL